MLACRHIIVRVTPEILLGFLTYNQCYTILNPLPPGASILTKYYSPENDVFQLVVEHESFDPIVVGDQLPIRDITIITNSCRRPDVNRLVTDFPEV